MGFPNKKIIETGFGNYLYDKTGFRFRNSFDIEKEIVYPNLYVELESIESRDTTQFWHRGMTNIFIHTLIEPNKPYEYQHERRVDKVGKVLSTLDAMTQLQLETEITGLAGFYDLKYFITDIGQDGSKNQFLMDKFSFYFDM